MMKNKTTALLVMDMQMGILPRLPLQGATVVEKVAEAIKIARESNLLVIFVRVGFQKGLPEVSAANKVFFCGKTPTEFRE